MSSDPTSLSVIVLNYKTPELTLICANTVLEEFKRFGLGGELIIVDNASGDGSDQKIDSWIQQQMDEPTAIRLIRSPRNGGFSYGNNRGLETAASSVVLLLNSDTEVRPGCFGALVQAKRDNPNAAVLGAQLEGDDGSRQVCRFRFISPLSELVSATAIGLVDKLVADAVVPIHLLSTDQDELYPPADWVSFAAVFLDRTLLPGDGLMDEGYFLYFEDTDFCQKVKRAGRDVLQAPQARVVHKRGGSGPVKANQKAGKRLPRYFYESRSRYLRLHYGGRFGLLRANFGKYVGYALASITLIYKKRRIQSVASEWRDIWIGWRTPL